MQIEKIFASTSRLCECMRCRGPCCRRRLRVCSLAIHVAHAGHDHCSCRDLVFCSETVYFDVLLQVRCRPNMEEIDLSGQQFTPDALQQLLTKLNKCTACRRMSLYSCGLSDASIAQIADVMKSWKTKLDRLDVRGNECSLKTIKKLEKVCVGRGLKSLKH